MYGVVGTPTPPVEEWAPRTRPGSNGLPSSPCDGQDAPLPGRRALGGLKTIVDAGYRSRRHATATRIDSR